VDDGRSSSRGTSFTFGRPLAGGREVSFGVHDQQQQQHAGHQEPDSPGLRYGQTDLAMRRPKSTNNLVSLVMDDNANFLDLQPVQVPPSSGMQIRARDRLAAPGAAMAGSRSPLATVKRRTAED